MYIKYDVQEGSRWSGEVHFPTAVLTAESIKILEGYMEKAGKPRFLHVFRSDTNNVLGDLKCWADGPKYGGVTGMEELPQE